MSVTSSNKGAALLNLAKGHQPAAPKRVSTRTAISQYFEAIQELRNPERQYSWDQIAQFLACPDIQIKRKPSTVKKAYEAICRARAADARKAAQGAGKVTPVKQTKPA